MTEAGLASIELAKQNGTWTALDEVDNLIIHEDLKNAFNKNKVAKNNFDAFPYSSKKIILGWIQNAKKPETRQKRIDEAVELAEKNIKANHYRQ
ncbi:MAG: YdeI/OmpD-associated family protein [Segetibacter sp.]